MTVHILPATRQALGDKPGEVLDAHFSGSNYATKAALGRRTTKNAEAFDALANSLTA